VDYDGDGVLDIISGCYDPGDIYLIRGLGDGRYAAVEALFDEDYTPLVHHPQELKRYLDAKNSANDQVASFGSWTPPMDGDADSKKKRTPKILHPKKMKRYLDSEDSAKDKVASFGSWATPMDWDADGDLDMLIGTFSGQIFLRTNVGTRESPQYDPSSTKVFADGKPFKVDSHASLVAADWNDDGLVDLVVGSGDGGVGWYENSGIPEQPKFGAKRLLVAAPSDSIFLWQFLYPDEASVPGTRAQICVSDYNGDGRLDLLVGDYCSRVELNRDWPEEQKAEMFAAFRRSQESLKRTTTLQKEFSDRFAAAKESDDIDIKDVNLEFQNELFRRAAEQKSAPFSLSKENEELVKQLLDDAKPASKVWLYLRKG